MRVGRSLMRRQHYYSYYGTDLQDVQRARKEISLTDPLAESSRSTRQSTKLKDCHPTRMVRQPQQPTKCKVRSIRPVGGTLQFGATG
jgi:hypothetical protein